jgi:Fur family peroxide stress response transcriptional regulator
MENLRDSRLEKYKDNPLVQGLRAANAPLTAQRLAICEWLGGSPDHPTVADIHSALSANFPTMSLATVYNTVGLLAELGLVTEITTAEDGSVRYDPRPEPHVNLICRRCGRVIDVLDVDLSALERIAPAYGFEPQGVDVVVRGICADCQRAEAEAAS